MSFKGFERPGAALEDRVDSGLIIKSHQLDAFRLSAGLAMRSRPPS